MAAIPVSAAFMEEKCPRYRIRWETSPDSISDSPTILSDGLIERGSAVV